MSAPGCRIKPKRPTRYTTKEQLKIMDKFLLKHPKLSCRLWERKLYEYERTEVNKLWEILKNRLNARGPGRDVRGWKDVLIRQQKKRILSPTQKQFKLIDKFLLDHPKLPYRPFTKRLNGYKRSEIPKIWANLRQRLNSRGPPKIHVKGWKQVCLQRRRLQKRCAKNIEALHKTSCAAIQPALPIRIEPAESNIKSCNNNDGVFGILEPDVVPETSQNDKTMSTISQDPPCGLRKTLSSPKPSKQQLAHLDEVILKQPDIEYIHRNQGYQWELSKNQLNNLGPVRTSKEWRTIWTMPKELAQSMETQQGTSCSALQPVLPIRTEPDEFNVKSCSNSDAVLGIIEPDVDAETSQNDKTMSAISQDLPRLRKRLPRPKTSKRQLELLDEYVLKHADRKKGYHWQMLKYWLNKCGPERTSTEWRTLWTMRKELAQSKETQQGTSCSALQPTLQIRIEPGEFNVKSCINDDGVFGIIGPEINPETSQNDKHMTITSTISQDEFHIKSELDLENGHEDVHELGNENAHEDSHELDEDCVHEDSHELDEENVHKDSHDMDEGNVHEDSHELDESCVHEDSHDLDEENVRKDSHELEEENVHEDSHELDEENNIHEEFHPTNSVEFQTQSQSEQRCRKCRCCCSNRTRADELFEKQFEMQTKFMQNLTEQREHFHIEILKILEENNKLLKENFRQKKEENDARKVKAEELRLKKIELKIMKAINDVKLKKLNL